MYKTARNLKAQMVRHGVKQVEVAQKIGMHPEHLNQYLNGWRQIPKELRVQIKEEIANARNGGMH